MTLRPSFVGKLALAAVLGGMLSLGCSAGPRPQVQDFDTYQTVRIGQLRYTTPEGYKVVARKQGYAEHATDALPDSRIFVRYDVNPPRDIKVDADAEKRRFLDAVPGSRLTSAQYSELDNRTRIKIMLEGMTRDEKKLAGSLLMVREGDRTATIHIVGPWEHRDDINHAVEGLGESLQFRDLTEQAGK